MSWTSETCELRRGNNFWQKERGIGGNREREREKGRGQQQSIEYAFCPRRRCMSQRWQVCLCLSLFSVANRTMMLVVSPADQMAISKTQNWQQARCQIWLNVTTAK